MNQADITTILAGAVSLLAGILGYFLHRTVSQVDSSIKKLETEHYKSIKSLEDDIAKGLSELKTQIHKMDSTVQVTGNTLANLAKRVEDIQKMKDQIDSLVAKIIVTETKLDHLGKIIYVGKRE